MLSEHMPLADQRHSFIFRLAILKSKSFRAAKRNSVWGSIGGLDKRGMAEVIIPQGQAEICIHILAVMEARGQTPDSLRGLVSDAVIQAEYRRRALDQVNPRPA